MSPNTTEPTSVDIFVTNPTFSVSTGIGDVIGLLGATKTRIGSASEDVNATEKHVLELSNDVTTAKFWIGFSDPAEAENFRFRQDLASR